MKKTLALLLLLAGLTLEAQGKDLVWNGSPGHMTWDLNDNNWFDRSYSELICRYEQGAYVHFGDTGSGVVTLDGELSPRGVYVTSGAGHDYTFTGKGKLMGEMYLSIETYGTLTINTANTFTGTTKIYLGTVVVGNEMALGSSRIVMSNYGGGLPTLDLGKYSISNSVVVDNSYASIGNGTLSGDLTLQKTSHLTLLDDTDITGNISLGDGASFNLADNTVTGAVTLSGSATIGNGTIEGDLQVAEGKKLSLLHDTTVTGTVNLVANAALDLGGNAFHMGGDVGNRIALAGSATISNGKIALANDMDTEYALILGDNATLDLNTHTLSQALSLNGSASISNGTITGRLSLLGASFTWSDDSLILAGEVELNNNATLDLGMHTLSNSVTISGTNATIGNGTIEGDMAVAEGKSLALLANTTVTGGVSLGAQSSLNLGGNTFHTGGDACNRVTFSGDTTVSNGKLVLDSDWSPGYALTFTGITLDLNKHTLSKAVTLVGNNAIGNGTLNTNLNVGAGDTLTLCGNLDGQQNKDDKIILGTNATLDLNNHSISKYCYVRINGDAFIGNGSFYSEVVVAEGKKLTLCGNLSSSGWYMGNIILEDKATLDLGKHTYSGLLSVKWDSATIGNGTLERDLSVGDGKTLNLCGDLGGSGAITLKDSATLNLGGHTLSKDVTLTGSATIGGGSLDGNLAVNSEKTLTLSGNLGGSGIITLGNKAKLDLGGHALTNNVIVDGSNTTITGGGGSFDGDITVQTGKSLKLDGDLDGIVDVTLGANSTLDLGSQDRYCSVTVIGNNAAILNGGLMLSMTIAENVNFTLSQNSAEISANIYLGGNNTLDLGGKTVYDISLGGKSATIGNGTVDKNIYMGNDTILTLSGDISFNNGGIVIVGSNSKVNLNGHTLTGRVRTYGVNTNNDIGNGTIAGNVIVDDGSNIRFFDETHFKGGTMTFENDPTTIKAVDAEKGGLLKEISVSAGVIAGTDRQTSLADGLEISRMGQDLKLQDLILTDNNKISVGNGHTITLNNVTIQLSQAHYELVDGSYYFNLKTLINCDLDMDTVTFDASGLSLGTAMEKVVFDFGEDVNIDSATRARLQLDEAWDGQAYITGPGLLVFSKSAPIPEPTTGTLSLLALAALCTRRRRRK